MIAKGHIFYIFLTFHLHGSTAELDPTYRVNVMNDILTHPGWRALVRPSGLGILVPLKDTAEKHVLKIQDFLRPDGDGQVVNYDNAEDKVRQAYQILSCRFGHALKLCYEYGLRAASQCEKFKDVLGLSNCVEIFLEMIKEVVEEMMPRLRGTFSCFYRVSPATTFDATVSEALDDFKSYHDNLAFNSGSLDKKYYKEILVSAEKTMDVGLINLRGFYDNSCSPPSQDEQRNGIAVVWIQKLEELYPTIEIMNKLKERLHKIVKWYVYNYDTVSFGFEYNPIEKTTRIMYSP